MTNNENSVVDDNFKISDLPDADIIGRSFTVIVNENDAQIIWGAAGRFDRISLEGLFDLCHSIESVASRELKHDKKYKEKIEHCLEDEEDWMITRADYKFLMAAKDCREMCANTIMFWIRKLGHVNGEPIYMMGPYAHLVANTHVMLGHEDVIYSFHNVNSIVDNPEINTLPICMFDNEGKLVMKDYYEFIEEMKCRFPENYRFDN
ncbi:MAG: hypothetical protein K6G81_07320 [Lachnospiraceae bacterium]|nr:hypothetical protein [Lachnospiraceae bacterium]